MKRVLVTGGTGLLGSNLLLGWQQSFKLSSVQLLGRTLLPVERQANFDLSDREKTLSFIQALKPDAVVHTAALVNVDYCEAHRDEAYRVNAIASENVAEACESIGSKTVFISTDSVFDGEKGNYSEEDRPNPVNAYAQSKLQGEKLVLERNPDAMVVRTCIYGWNSQEKKSLSEWIYHGLKEGEKLNLFNDVFFSPILVNDLGDALAELIEKDFSGTINIAGTERLSKLEFGKMIAGVFGFGKENIREASVEDSGLAAKRPKDASLNVEKALGIIDSGLPGAREGIERKKRLLDEGFVRRLKAGFAK